MEKKTGAKKTAAKKTKKKTEKHTETREASTSSRAKKTKKAPRAKKAKPCKIKGCKRHYRAKGYCGAHYKMWRHGKFGKARFTRCHDYGCTKPMALNRQGFCEDHYQAFYVKGLEQTHAPAAPAKPAKVEKAAENAA